MNNFRHINNTFTNHFDLFIPWFWLVFGATRIHINDSWYGSGSDQMIRIRPDPDPKRCNIWIISVSWFPPGWIIYHLIYEVGFRNWDTWGCSDSERTPCLNLACRFLEIPVEPFFLENFIYCFVIRTEKRRWTQKFLWDY